MSVIRVEHDKNNPYVVVNKSILSNNKISAEAKTIYFYAFSRQDDWQFRRGDIENHMKEGRDQIKRALKELEKFGYLVRKGRRVDGSNLFNGWDWVFYETPREDSNNSSESLKTRPSGNQAEIISKELKEEEEEELAGPEKENPLKSRDVKFYQKLIDNPIFSCIATGDIWDAIQRYGGVIVAEALNNLIKKNPSLQQGKVPVRMHSPSAIFLGECKKEKKRRVNGK